ncbi:hypothetical protein [Candidatus Hydrogenosomobacter endosymbioticus]|uniref:Uncharacterized protein n=1 Tax=Candidatus Hydrogenosomobacter endosymbioticus TaxID=2558174 RepID=A0ABM7V9S9_9PROT|nr:hypothetical protein [Candidatus Hydrogenosomobacter endosymbioticus]BDB96554.1 hypothetical protein HYD_6870 [Candidatus Hydrogenosomobacter endosymbioticus]
MNSLSKILVSLACACIACSNAGAARVRTASAIKSPGLQRESELNKEVGFVNGQREKVDTKSSSIKFADDYNLRYMLIVARDGARFYESVKGEVPPFKSFPENPFASQLKGDSYEDSLSVGFESSRKERQEVIDQTMELMYDVASGIGFSLDPFDVQLGFGIYALPNVNNHKYVGMISANLGWDNLEDRYNVPTGTEVSFSFTKKGNSLIQESAKYQTPNGASLSEGGCEFLTQDMKTFMRKLVDGAVDIICGNEILRNGRSIEGAGVGDIQINVYYRTNNRCEVQAQFFLDDKNNY